MGAEQPITVGFASDNEITVAMSPPVDVTGWDVRLVVYDDEGDAAFELSPAATTLSTGVWKFNLSPDVEGMEPERRYSYQVERIDDGARDPYLAWGALFLKVPRRTRVPSVALAMNAH